jgi:hypothetical protein
MIADVLDGGRAPGNREVSRLGVRARARVARAHAVPEEGVRGGTWFPRGSEAKPSDGVVVEPEAVGAARPS